MQGQDENFVIQPLKIACTIIKGLFITLALLTGLGSYTLIVSLLTIFIIGDNRNWWLA